MTLVSAGHPKISELDRVPLALARFVRVGHGHELAEANALALTMLGSTIGELSGSGFADGLFESDANTLTAALASAGSEPSSAVLLRWGPSPPVVFLSVRVQCRGDGSILASMQDLTDQYRLDTLLCGQGGGVFLTDADSYITWLSPLTQVILGIPAETMVGLHMLANIHPDDAADQAAATADLLASPGVETVHSWRYHHPLINDTWWTMRYTEIYLPNDPAVGGVIMKAELVVDPAEQSLAGSQSQMTLAEMLPAGLIMAAAGRISFRNNLARLMLGTSIAGTEAYAWIDSLAPKHRPVVLDLVRSAETSGRRGVTTAALDRPGKSPMWLRIEAMPALDGDGRPVGYAATLLDVSAETEARAGLEEAQKQLWHLANHDTLTALPNRMQFNDCLDRALARKKRDAQNVALLFCDVDFFKPVNDRQGHQAGDVVLAEIARRLGSVTRATDTVCRIGGDEFGIICEAFPDVAGLETLASRLVGLVSEPVQIGMGTAKVGLSIGVAVATADSTAEDLLSRADAALYQAKASGRGRFIMST